MTLSKEEEGGGDRGHFGKTESFESPELVKREASSLSSVVQPMGQPLVPTYLVWEEEV